MLRLNNINNITKAELLCNTGTAHFLPKEAFSPAASALHPRVVSKQQRPAGEQELRDPAEVVLPACPGSAQEHPPPPNSPEQPSWLSAPPSQAQSSRPGCICDLVLSLLAQTTTTEEDRKVTAPVSSRLRRPYTSSGGCSCRRSSRWEKRLLMDETLQLWLTGRFRRSVVFLSTSASSPSAWSSG